MSRLLQAQRRNSETFISHPKDRRTYWLFGKSQTPLNVRWNFGILTDWDWRARQIKNAVNKPQTLPVRANAIRRRKHTDDIPKSERSYSFMRKMTVDTSLPRRYRDTLKEHQHAPGALVIIIDPAPDAEVTLTLNNCLFFALNIKYLAHVIRPGRLKPSYALTASIRKFKDPTAEIKLKSFLNLCHLFHRFTQNFSRLISALNLTLREDQPPSFSFSKYARVDKVENLRTRLENPAILTLSRTTCPYTVDIDA